MLVEFPYDYIASKVLKKEEKYEQYSSGKWNEIIIVASSEYLSLASSVYHLSWTWYLLSKQEFSFDKVVFVSEIDRCPSIVFDRRQPQLAEPVRNLKEETGITKVQTPVLPVNKEVNIKSFFDEQPIITGDKKKDKKIR